VIVINKAPHAQPDAVRTIRDHAAAFNPTAEVVESDLLITIENEREVAGKRVLVVEDGPTLTHGGMSYGAGVVAAKRASAAEIMDPRPFAVGTIAECYRNYPHIGPVLPALGYSPRQRQELEHTIRVSNADIVVDASPARLSRCIQVSVPFVRVGYEFQQRNGPPLDRLIEQFLQLWDARIKC
jgi:predicted GTPase